MPSPASITVSQLSRLIGTPSAPVLIDLRIDEDFNSAPLNIPGAFRHPFQSISTLTPELIGQHVVIICHRGKKISQGATAILREASIQAESLQGGQVAWAEAALPLVSITHLDNRNAENRTVWVTRHRPKIDRIACPWLIKRFIDSKAQFLYVEPAEVIDVADRFNAIAFDAEGALYTHQDNECTFDALLKAFKLNDKALNHLAQIIRGADTGNHDIAPQSAGLLAASLGFSRMYKNDNAQLEACLPLYDALYRWCRDATDEQHNDASHAH